MWIQLDQKAYLLCVCDSRGCQQYKGGVADVLRMRRWNNGQKVNIAEIDAGGGPETVIPLVVALWLQNWFAHLPYLVSVAMVTAALLFS